MGGWGFLELLRLLSLKRRSNLYPARASGHLGTQVSQQEDTGSFYEVTVRESFPLQSAYQLFKSMDCRRESPPGS